jgi:hypothetical protein
MNRTVFKQYKQFGLVLALTLMLVSTGSGQGHEYNSFLDYQLASTKTALLPDSVSFSAGASFNHARNLFTLLELAVLTQDITIGVAFGAKGVEGSDTFMSLNLNMRAVVYRFPKGGIALSGGYGTYDDGGPHGMQSSHEYFKSGSVQAHASWVLEHWLAVHVSTGYRYLTGHFDWSGRYYEPVSERFKESLVPVSAAVTYRLTESVRFNLEYVDYIPRSEYYVRAFTASVGLFWEFLYLEAGFSHSLRKDKNSYSDLSQAGLTASLGFVF